MFLHWWGVSCSTSGAFSVLLHGLGVSLPEYFKNGDNKITHNVKIANYWIFVYKHRQGSCKQNKNDSNRNYSYYLTEKFDILFQFQEINEGSILKIIDHFPAKSSSGCDGITLKQLKYLKYVLIKSLTLLINQILNTEIFSEKMKIAKVIPIFLNDDESSFCNYRPISLLPIISKVIEKVIYNQIYSFFTKHQLFNDNQYGVRSGHSTEYAVMEVIDWTITALDSNETPINIFLDLSKAFDTLDHSILLSKLQLYGMDADALKLMESYLNNRKQYVIYNDLISETLPIITGAPQGSILGPLLFLIYINDLPNSSETFKYVMYADDTTLFTTIQSSNICPKDVEYKLNIELNKINEWLKIWVGCLLHNRCLVCYSAGGMLVSPQVGCLGCCCSMGVVLANMLSDDWRHMLQTTRSPRLLSHLLWLLHLQQRCPSCTTCPGSTRSD